jgi:transposase-like protein
VCPHCGSTEAYRLTAKPGSASPVRPGVCKCKECRKQFTVRVGTIFEDSKLPISKWLMAIHLMTSSKKGVSSHQIARELGVTVKTAWFVTHRIREAMKLEPMAGMLNGTVEADEAYIGGKPRPRDGKVHPKGRSTDKQPVMVLVSREWRGGVQADSVCFDGGPHQHGRSACCERCRSYDRRESVLRAGWSHNAGPSNLQPRQEGIRPARRERQIHDPLEHGGIVLRAAQARHYGTFHQLSKQHLFRYCNEFGFRWTFRKTTDGERMMKAIEGAEGRRLTYRQPKEQAAEQIALLRKKKDECED